MAFFQGQRQVITLGCYFFLWKIEIFFLFSSRPVNTFNCQKSAFWIRTQGTSEFLAKNIIDFLRIRIPEFSSKFWLFLNYFQFLSNLKFKFWNVVLKIEFLGSEYLNLVANFDSFKMFLVFVTLLVQILKCQTVQKMKIIQNES